MPAPETPLIFDISGFLTRARRLIGSRLGDVTLTFPFLSIAISPKDVERKVAREVMIRLRDRRVLSARECCDDCIARSLSSLQEIRKVLVDKQVELADVQDGPLYLVLDLMATGVRQFMTFEEVLHPTGRGREPGARYGSEQREQYFAALEVLRDHLNHCIQQVAAIAKMDSDAEVYLKGYEGPWRLTAYKGTPPGA